MNHDPVQELPHPRRNGDWNKEDWIILFVIVLGAVFIGYTFPQ